MVNARAVVKRAAEPAGDGRGPLLQALLDRLSLEDKVLVLTGRDGWSTHPLPAIGLRSMVLSDGPSGVRGDVWDERSPSLSLPCSSALSASWDTAMSHRYGAVAAGEARRKGVDVLLGPLLNLQRSPLGGRHFEAFSEDPVLTGVLAASYVRSVQERGVAATPKAYVGNDSETDRFRIDARIPDRALHEVYLLAFEDAVRQAGAWAVMSAYNSVNGTTMSENELLAEPLNGEWGFDGVVVSDWQAVRSIEAALLPQDLAMPGPASPWGPALVSAVRDGRVAQALIDRKVARLLRLAARVGALEVGAGEEVTPVAQHPVDDVDDGTRFAREAAAAGMVLVRNESALPLSPDQLSRVALLGEAGRTGAIQGGGSATVVPGAVVQPLAGLAAAMAGVQIDYHVGATVRSGFTGLEHDRLRNPVTGGPGIRVSYRDEEGREVLHEDRTVSTIFNFGARDTIPGCVEVVLTTAYTPELSGSLDIGFAHPGHGRLLVDGLEQLNEEIPPAGEGQIDDFFDPAFHTVAVPTVAGSELDLELHYVPGEWLDGVEGSFAVILGSLAPERDGDALITAAAHAAAEADVAVVVVGTTAREECEGYDRKDLRLPGRQDDLVAAVVQANPATVVVVNSGSPVEMPWRDDVAAILLTWFPGQEFGHALADVLTGAVEPGGRLPNTWPTTLADTPVSVVTPVDGQLHYDEGIHVGHRAWLKAGRHPAYPFGHGLGYTTWSLKEATASTTDAGVLLEAMVTNTGKRLGKQVVQVYAARPGSSIDRPLRWLVGFEVARVNAGESAIVAITVPLKRFQHWDAGWILEPGDFQLLVGFSVDDLPITLNVTADAALTKETR